MDGNMPIPYQNILFGLPAGIAQDAFLWAVDRPGEDRACYRAERYAREVHKLVEGVGPMTRSAAGIHDKASDGRVVLFEAAQRDMVRFILARHANLFYGGNVRLGYLPEDEATP